MIRTIVLTTAVGAALSFSAADATVRPLTAATATTLNFVIDTSIGDGSGQLVTSGAGSPVAITSITGNFDGSAITGLSAYASADQLLYASMPAFDFSGVSFIAGGVSYNLSDYEGGAAGGIANSVSDPGGAGSSQGAITFFSTSAVPEPAAWALMLVGFGGLGAALRSRRKSAISQA